ncbi:mediator of RNA polymerase II transcription subunit 4 isoform X2 [Lingula anatina]|uniref:Mediator of RNA polymerase II transcription subunit 4 n=1 Tax=Lingula anatina TaxID=7574 RepID=A0A1S3HDT9_LINAN|nr:mediator of RNA polymerase II transcription subunit 4-like [Lingula anatina]XP_013413279.1 mediator of RNA polymerase II transcription subunit 4 isoform X2 [Lingula anatina]|eukprot:XP_013384208.1 mediator of RNA polymerase II transcription subunit 4-like [Lingula anatina]
MAAPGTKQVLLSLIEDVEIITKELFELMSAKKTETSTEPVADTGQLMELLLKKDAEIQAALKTATEQGEVQKKIEALQVEVDRRDADILQLQKNLKEAETILATAIYQAKQKLTSIKQANQKSIPSEELIKYAHKISSSHAVAAPNTWQPGDPRRPYPTELDMRMGFLGRLNNPNFQSQPGLGADPQLSRQPGQLDHTPSHAVYNIDIFLT